MGNLTLSEIVNNKLCNTCGGCFGICPSHAIGYQETIGGYFFPVVDEEACNHCGLCVDICPGAGFDPTLLARLPNDPFSGHTLESYVGRVVNKKLFDNSQSGGIVSGLLSHSLKSGRIKGAVTTSMEFGMPPRPKVQVARNWQEIYQAQKSKYSPIPLLGFLNEFKKTYSPVAVVGISCQIHGLCNILAKLPKKQDNIAFTVGLVCDKVLTFAAMDYLVAKSRISKKDASLLYFRDKSVSGYPGDVHVFSANGSSVVMPSATRKRIKNYFTPARCRICFDKMNVFSDITIGDPHGLAGVDKKFGESILVVRTELGMKVVKAAWRDKFIDIRPVRYDQVLNGQKINKKREQWEGYIRAWKHLGLELPNYHNVVSKHAPDAFAKNKKYMQDIQSSLNLDEFSSREKIIRHVEKCLKKKRLKGAALFPFRFTKRVVQKIFSLIVHSLYLNF